MLQRLAALALSGCVSVATGLEDGTRPVVLLPMTCQGCEVIRHVSVLDADGARTNRRVLLFDGGVVADSPDDGPVLLATEIDGVGKTLIPGLWDAHVHLMSSADGQNSSRHLPEALKGYLYNGVTAVVDMGSDGQTTAALRQRLLDGELVGPRLFAAGRFVTAPGGHPCTAWYPEVCAPLGASAPAEQVVDSLMPLKPDLIKVIIEGGGPPLPTFPRLLVTEVRALSGAARKKGLKVAAHISSVADLDDALAAPVDILAHLPVRGMMNESQVGVIVGKRTPTITTLSFYDGLLRVLDAPGEFDAGHILSSVPPDELATLLSPQVRAFYGAGQGLSVSNAFRSYLVTLKANVQKVDGRGGLLVAGSDSGNFAVFHGAGLVRELELLVGAGLTIPEAVAAATAAPAEMMGQAERLGRVRAGMAADLVLLDGDLATDIAVLRRIARVWLNGRQLDRSKLTVAAPRGELIARAAPKGVDAFCIDDSGCAVGLTCDTSRWRCLTRCQLNDPSTCPAGFGCESLSGSATSGVCLPGTPCDPVLQNCPFAPTYRTTCVPFESDYNRCVTAGSAAQGAACARSGDCAQGLVCGPSQQCQQTCAPPSGSCPGSTSCADESSLYGQTVGLCR